MKEKKKINNMNEKYKIYKSQFPVGHCIRANDGAEFANAGHGGASGTQGSFGAKGGCPNDGVPGRWNNMGSRA